MHHVLVHPFLPSLPSFQGVPSVQDALADRPDIHLQNEMENSKVKITFLLIESTHNSLF